MGGVGYKKNEAKANVDFVKWSLNTNKRTFTFAL